MDGAVRGHGGVLYRVDPRLFKDGDDDGVGDLAGLIAGLPYLRWLGVDGLWLAPTPPRPVDGIASLVAVPGAVAGPGAPVAFARLAREAHRLGLRVFLDDAPAVALAPANPAPLPADRGLDVEPSGSTATRLAARSVTAGRWLRQGADAVWTGHGWVGSAVTGGSDRPIPVPLSPPMALLPDDDRPGGREAGGHRSALSRIAEFDLRRFAAILAACGPLDDECCPLWQLSPPASPRAAARLGPVGARLAATVLLTLPGVVAVAAGDEVGVVDGFPPSLCRRRGGECAVERAAMPWDGAGGLAAPWRPLVEGGAAPVARQQEDRDSLLALHRRLIGLRASEPALNGGSVVPLLARGGLLAYLIEGAGRRLLVALNGGPDAAAVPCQRPFTGHVAVATERSREGSRVANTVALAPGEALVIRITV